MSGPTIEEAWALVAERLGWTTFKDSSIEPEKAVIRAALLAVLEEVNDAVQTFYILNNYSPMYSQDWDAILVYWSRRIEALGG